MQLSPIGLPVSELDTPALLIDMEPLEQNIEQNGWPFQGTWDRVASPRQGVQVPGDRPHAAPRGAIGVTVAKVSEAEVMAAGGIDDILIAHLVVGRSKAARLAALQRQADVKVTVDHPDHVAPLGQAARDAGTTIGVLVDVDVGMKRTGVATARAAVELARLVSSTSGLRFDGLMGYEGQYLDDPRPALKTRGRRHGDQQVVTARATSSRPTD